MTLLKPYDVLIRIKNSELIIGYFRYLRIPYIGINGFYVEIVTLAEGCNRLNKFMLKEMTGFYEDNGKNVSM
jgi:hypothetical protein